MTARLNVEKVAVGAFLIPWLNRRTFGRALVIPLLLLASLTLSWYYSSEHLSQAVKWGLYFLYGVLFSVIAVTCHRLVLLDFQEAASRSTMGWSSREMRFFIWMVGIWCIFAIIAISLTGLFLILLSPWIKEPNATWPQSAVLAAKLPAFYVCARCSMVFPAIAVDRQVNLKWAWNLSKDNGWRLVLVVTALPWLISHAVDLLYRDNATVIETIILTFLGTAFIAVEIAAISLAYRELIKGEEDDMIEPNLPSDPDTDGSSRRST